MARYPKGSSFGKEHHKRYHQNDWLVRRYGITLDNYNSIAESQNWGCAICGKKPGPKKKISGHAKLVVDHNHKTGQVRGLICASCNFAIGMVYDSPDTAFGLFKYLIERG